MFHAPTVQHVLVVCIVHLVKVFIWISISSKWHGAGKKYQDTSDYSTLITRQCNLMLGTIVNITSNYRGNWQYEDNIQEVERSFLN